MYEHSPKINLNKYFCPINCLIVIPAYCESKRLPLYLRTLAIIMESEFPNTRILVVDDGSPQVESRNLLEQIQAIRTIHSSVLEPLLLRSNVGKGAAILKGWSFCRNYDAYGFVDADGAVSAHELARLLRLFAEDESQNTALFGSRMRKSNCKVERSIARHLMGRIFALLVYIFVDNSLYDTQCGVKLISARAYKKVASLMDGMRFAFDVELLAALKTKGENVKEVPVEWKDIPGSKINVLKDSLQMLQGIFQIRKKKKIWMLQKKIK
jgi:dolichyl-phosphate beta-glucosyltransferase